MNMQEKCTNCQSVNSEGTIYCTNCGLELTNKQVIIDNPDIQTILDIHEGNSKVSKKRPFYTKKSYWLALFVLLVIAGNYCDPKNDQDLQPVTKSTMAIYLQNESTQSNRIIL